MTGGRSVSPALSLLSQPHIKGAQVDIVGLEEILAALLIKRRHYRKGGPRESRGFVENYQTHPLGQDG
jgi:hypothetical protein